MNKWKKVIISGVLATSFATYFAGSANAEAIISKKSSVKDTKAPGIPVLQVNKAINSLNYKKFEVKGKAERNSKVIGTLMNGKMKITFSTKVDSKGNFKTFLNTQKLQDGTLSLSIYDVDASGNQGKVRTLSILKDTSLEEVTIENDGYINSLNQDEYPVSGTGEPNSTIYVTIQGGKQIVTGKTIVDDLGNFSLNVNATKLPDGKIAIQVKEIDKAGNTNKSFVTLTKDTKSPVNPVLFPALNVTADTNQSTYTVKGLGIPGSEIEVVLSDGNVEVSSVGEVDLNGVFEVELDTTDLGNGTITITAAQTNAAGNVSAEATSSFTKDLAAPNASEVNSLVTINQENQANYAVTGKGEIGATVSVVVTDGKTTVTKYVNVDEQGAFSANLDLTNLQSGNVIFIVSQSDKSHNSSAPVTSTVQKN